MLLETYRKLKNSWVGGKTSGSASIYALPFDSLNEQGWKHQKVTKLLNIKVRRTKNVSILITGDIRLSAHLNLPT